MTNYTFKTIGTNTSNNCTFCPKHTNYSEILDSIIASNIKKCNPYLSNNDDFIAKMMKDSDKKNGTIIYNGCDLLKDDKFIKATNFLANYKKNAKKLPFIIGKIYKLTDGTPIIFYDDEIQIGLDLFSYDDFSDIKFLGGLNHTSKCCIINIFSMPNIKINIL